MTLVREASYPAETAIYRSGHKGPSPDAAQSRLTVVQESDRRQKSVRTERRLSGLLYVKVKEEGLLDMGKVEIAGGKKSRPVALSLTPAFQTRRRQDSLEL